MATTGTANSISAGCWIWALILAAASSGALSAESNERQSDAGNAQRGPVAPGRYARPVVLKLIARGDDFLVHRMNVGEPAVLPRRSAGECRVRVNPAHGGVFHTRLSTGEMRCLAQSWSATYGPFDLGYRVMRTGTAHFGVRIVAVEHHDKQLYVLAIWDAPSLRPIGETLPNLRDWKGNTRLSVFALPEGTALGEWHFDTNEGAQTLELTEDGVRCAGHTFTFSQDKPTIVPGPGPEPVWFSPERPAGRAAASPGT